MFIHPKVFKLEALSQFGHDQIVFRFNQPVIKESFEKNFKIYPDVEGEFIWEDFNRQVTFLPSYLEYDIPYSASISDIRSYVLTKLKQKKIDFKVTPPSSLNLAKITPNKLPKAEKNVFINSDNQTVILGEPRTTEGKLIDIDISDQILATYQDGRIVGVYEVSTGRPDMPTPVGEFKVLNKEENHWSVKYGLYMPYSLRFYSDFFIHELPYWPSGYREGTDHLGMRVSHGCIRLGIGPAKEVYDFADIGIAVVIRY